MNAQDALDPIRSLKAVGRAVAAAPAALLLWWFGGLAAIFVVYFVAYLSGVAVALTAMRGGEPPEPAVIALLVVGGLVVLTVLMLAAFWWQLGLATILAEILRTGRGDIATGLATWRRVPAMVGAQLLLGLLTLVAYVPVVLAMLASGGIGAALDEPAMGLLVAIPLGCAWIVGVIWASLGIVFVPHAVAFDGKGPLGAIGHSWSLARGLRWKLFLFLLVTMLCAMAGLLALCIGYIVTLALAHLMPAEAYLALTRGDEYSRWWIATGRAPEDEPSAPPAGA
ncbi:MAG: hypothetical protein HZA53_07000 [Planctomycetes bacterium]|nr:hypothetical protein [Planctomycetota bacterium]